MLSFFRRIIYSRVGVIITGVVLVLIALAFAATDITGLTPGSSGVGRNDVAEVGGRGVGAAELRQLARNEVESVRAQQPTFDVSQYVSAGGLEATLDRLITGLALFRFGEEQGMTVGKRSVDGQIASIPALRDATGRFDQALYESLLRQRGLTDAQIRQDIARGLTQWDAIVESTVRRMVPEQLALPYASLLLERRQGRRPSRMANSVPTGPAPMIATSASISAVSGARGISGSSN